MQKIHRAEISAVFALIISFVMSVLSFSAECGQVRNDVIRLHILANSDSEYDQQVKIEVRDALLSSGAEIFSGKIKKEEAGNLLKAEKAQLLAAANSVLEAHGCDYEADIYLTEEYFQTRAYENYTMPAGKYLALKVILGKGEGHNWWCVMFPPLCLPAAVESGDVDAVFDENELSLIASSPEYEIRFKAVELFERLKKRLDTRSTEPCMSYVTAE